MRVLLPAEMRAVDTYAISRLGIPGAVLMENAGAAVAQRVGEVIASQPSPRVVVFCGPGNNGGDGYVVARRLVQLGVSVSVYVFCHESSVMGDAKTHLQWLRHCGIEPRFVETITPEIAEAADQANVIVDALLGTGLRGVVTGLLAESIALINRSDALVISVDIPSGVDAATGKVLGIAVNADITVTFAYPKVGQLVYPGRGFCGKLEVVDIGIPSWIVSQIQEVQSNMYLIEASTVGRVLPRRIQPSHKGTYGRLIVIAGSSGMPGAASLACAGALRSGVGTVVAIVPRSIQQVVHAHNVEVMSCAAPESEDGCFSIQALELAVERLSSCAAYVLGPGLGRNDEVGQFVSRLLGQCDVPGVIDADGLMALARLKIDPGSLNSPAVLTPHPGEMSALTGLSVADIVADPVGVCTRYSSEWGQTVVLKGATTVVGLPDGTAHISVRGNAGLATGGTGDVLAGLIGGLIAQGTAPPDAAIAGVYVHGLAGELASQALGMASMLARDVAAHIPSALLQIAGP